MFQVGDLPLLKKHNADKMDLRWEPNYRVIRLMSPWSAVLETKSAVKPSTVMLETLIPNIPQRNGS